MAKVIKKWVDTGYTGCDYLEYERLPDNWEDLSEEEKNTLLSDVASDFTYNNIEYGAYVVETEEDEDFNERHMLRDR